MTEENKLEKLFWSPVGSNDWQPLGEAIVTPHFPEDETPEKTMTHWKGKGTFTLTATGTVNSESKLTHILRGKKYRLPRKLKKAVKKLCIYETAFDYYVCRIDGGNFKTKWLRKAVYYIGRNLRRC